MKETFTAKDLIEKLATNDDFKGTVFVTCAARQNNILLVGKGCSCEKCEKHCAVMIITPDTQQKILLDPKNAALIYDRLGDYISNNLKELNKNDIH